MTDNKRNGGREDAEVVVVGYCVECETVRRGVARRVGGNEIEIKATVSKCGGLSFVNCEDHDR